MLVPLCRHRGQLLQSVGRIHRQIRCYYDPHRTTAASIAARRPPPIDDIHSLFNSLGLPQLPDEVAVQTVTHKSFSHGVNGYNEKFAFCGRRLLELRIAKHLLTRPKTVDATTQSSDASNSSWFSSSSAQSTHQTITNKPRETEKETSSGDFNWDAVKGNSIRHILSRIGPLALSINGLTKVMQWKPQSQDAHTAGIKKVAGETLCAMIGVVELRCGQETATKFVDEQVIPRLNMT